LTKSLVQIKGFQELQRKLKQLGDDKTKRREVTKILGQVANSTVKAAKSLAPVSKKPHIQKRKNQRFGSVISPGTGKRSIGKKAMRRSTNPMVVVSPRSTKKADGWYLRQFVIKGTRDIKANPFLDRAYTQTKGGVTIESEKKLAKYIQKQINKLSK
jgi:HK97 gp10 family phage protein